MAMTGPRHDTLIMIGALYDAEPPDIWPPAMPTQRKIAEVLNVSLHSVHQRVHGLEQSGYVKIHPKFGVALTTAGMNYLVHHGRLNKWFKPKAKVENG